MSTAPEPAPPGAAPDTGHAAEQRERGPSRAELEAAASSGGVGEPRSRLRPPPPTPTHAPQLLGLDAAGGEHFQGPADPDDESLVGRCWGCGCGWRGTVRDVATRHFRPRVGDGGGLRRKRLARADRDARGGLDAHLAATATAAPTGPTPPAAAALPPRTTADPERPRGLRPRLTLPRTTPVADIPVADTSAPGPASAAGETHNAASHNAVTDNAETGHADPAPSPARPPAVVPGGEQGQPAPADGPTGDTTTGPVVADIERQTTGGGDRDLEPTRQPATGTARTPLAHCPGGDALAAAATRAQAARAALDAAETALDAAVVAARADGASWRTIARATGVAHREAAARWGQDSAGPSL